ncbi:putative ADP-ribosylation factor GTPase-activating protein AGD15 [Abeliophyllum distichum]|uniref:ADP-ribosylation factor GTPase-activating protein AGD15 n=1 Tax=Abeliophyllum distichum TaxID=126358 RepID=A0ABD1PD78_9LAMI
MNDKASVSKELNAKHTKILEGLFKLPENRECADCRSKAPRWASINLGIFICMQCSGIHRSLGVHISKVRSTTLDTWLPEQVAFMQSMSNEKSNCYWEAELPPNFDRNPIEKFIHSKYVEKKWASKTTIQPMPLVGQSRSGIPKKARKYSLEEEAFSSNMPQIAPITRARGGSLDLMNDIMSAPPKAIISNESTSRKSVDAATDLFSLLYVSDANQDRTVVPPSRWATFDFREKKKWVGCSSCKKVLDLPTCHDLNTTCGYSCPYVEFVFISLCDGEQSPLLVFWLWCLAVFRLVVLLLVHGLRTGFVRHGNGRLSSAHKIRALLVPLLGSSRELSPSPDEVLGSAHELMDRTGRAELPTSLARS